MYATGLRVSEAVALQVGHIDGRSRMLLVACGKGQKQRGVPVSPTLLNPLRAWWRQHRNPRWLFPGPSSDRTFRVCRRIGPTPRCRVGLVGSRLFGAQDPVPGDLRSDGRRGRRRGTGRLGSGIGHRLGGEPGQRGDFPD